MGRFKSRAHGFNKAIPHYICKSCNVVFSHTKPVRIPRTSEKPTSKCGKYVHACTSCDGREFIRMASKMEFERYKQLKLELDAGQITDLRIQPRYSVELNGNRHMIIADFEYQRDGKLVVEDVKSDGTDTNISRLKRDVLADKTGIQIEPVYMRGGRRVV